ncbi:ATP-dependent dethiobiotin synthetase BioD [Flexivirga sp. ID2601S]|uniref:ATP-dependent dethiobiotin synthetase BioD n=1 Tax=Flexivirga aerilata TaxID=1656889 RepID=A0A849AU26_9MICO|nr:dethiobiotin synthase [Flexivirga aerilata]NNG40222.1 ATP-dependent dethiobiotin synthetase BioD [Flexivirga aerilata]
MTVLIVTGTDTDVGKTVATAAVAAALQQAGDSVVVYKPTQTGVQAGEAGDVAEVERLTGVAGVEGVRLREPMAPPPAAALEDAELPTLADHVATIERLAASHDAVLVEGAGGLLVELTSAGETLADLAATLPQSSTVVVARPGLGTLNHTALTLEALQRRQIRIAGVIIGSWPRDPSQVELSNRRTLADGPAPLLGVIADGAGAMARDRFRAEATGWLPGLTVASPVGTAADSPR